MLDPVVLPGRNTRNNHARIGLGRRRRRNLRSHCLIGLGSVVRRGTR